MFTISKFAKLAGVTEKAIRLYEKNGLLTSIRSSNNYRYFNEIHLQELKKIVTLKSLGLSLSEIKSIILNSEENTEIHLNDFYHKQLSKTEFELLTLFKRKEELSQKIYLTNKIIGRKKIDTTVDKEISKNVTKNVTELLRLREIAFTKYQNYGKLVEEFFEREKFFDSDTKIQYIEDIKTLLEYLEKTKIKIGYLRGPASSSIILNLLGINSINPLDYDLIPERFSKEKLFLDIDVEFTRGNELIWFCKELTHDRPYKFEAYKLPLLDIFENTIKRINKTINIKAIPDLDASMKHFIKTGDCEYIPFLYVPENSSVYKIWGKDQNMNTSSINHNLQKLDPSNLRDIWGYISLEGRKHTIGKFNNFLENIPYENFDSLPEFEKKLLAKNRGHLLFEEEWITILANYVNNDFEIAESTRREVHKKGEAVLNKFEIPNSVKKLLSSELNSLFNLSHIVSFWQHSKIAAYFKYHHKEIYIDEIKKFEEKNPGYSWGDVGFKSDGITLMQN